MSSIPSTSGRLHSEFIRLLFLQSHRETDRFFATSGVQLAQKRGSGLFHFRRAAFLVTLKAKVGSTLTKVAVLRMTLNIVLWGSYHFKNTYSPITRTNISSIDLVSIFRCSSSPINPVYVRCVDFSDFVFSLSSQRHSYIVLVFNSRFLLSSLLLLRFSFFFLNDYNNSTPPQPKKIRSEHPPPFFLVFHFHTDTHIKVFFLTPTLSFHNKQH
jgi:hypothetical protein